MSRHTLGMALLYGSLIALMTAGPALTEENKKEDRKPQTTKRSIETKPKKYAPATAVDFEGELGLAFVSLETLGARIEAARRAGDPIGLATAALELAAAEAVADKKASLTGEALLKEASDMALLRGHSKELKMLAHLVKDEKLAKTFQAEAEKRTLEEDERPKGADIVKVINRTGEAVHVWIDGRDWGYHRAGSMTDHFINKRHQRVSLFARHSRKQWSAVLTGEYRVYEFILAE